MKPKQLIIRSILLGFLVTLIPNFTYAAGQLTARSATPTTSQAGVSANYSVKFTLATSGQTLGSIKFEICDSPVAATSCSGNAGSSGASFGAATLGSVTGLSGSWSANAGTSGGAGGTSIVFKKASAGVESGTPSATVVIDGVTNPTASNTEYYLRVSTYTDTAASTPAYPGTDFGGIAMSTANQITVSGTMPESLVFCVGTSGTDCTNISGTAVNLGTFSPTVTNSGTSLMDVSTNAGSGYAVTVNGTTLMSGATPITACSSGCSSTTGTSQFGTNLMANTTPSVGAGVNPATGGSFTGSAAAGYNTANSFKFNSGDTVATSTGTSNAQLFTNSYIVNVPGSQAAGIYTSTFTYICTATF